MPSRKTCSGRRWPASGTIEPGVRSKRLSQANPLSPGAYANLAMLETETGNPSEAARRYAEALLLDPTSETSRRGLEEATPRC